MDIREEPLTRLADHARISIAFEVTTIFEVSLRDRGLGGFVLTERPIAPPFVKDYDAIAGNHPEQWATRFDLATWGLVAAFEHDRRLGGAVVAVDTPGMHMLAGRSDAAVLWDLRVDATARRRGVGSALFDAATQWAIARGCRALQVETQNINVPACRFYARQGCTLAAVNRFAYPELPDEVQLVWLADLGRAEGAHAVDRMANGRVIRVS